MIPFLYQYNWLLIILAASIAFFITHYSIPTILEVSRKKRLFDEPNGRTSHQVPVPRLGGIGIFAGLIISLSLFVEFEKIGYLQYVIPASIIIFFTGLKDDILVISPNKKLLGQILAASFIVILGDLRISSLHGLFGVWELNHVVSIALTVFGIITIINAFNLIDGVDGLASGFGILVAITLGAWFYITGFKQISILAASLIGALFAFMRFNIKGRENKLFMGDLGSMLVGFIISVMVIRFNQVNAGFHEELTIMAPFGISMAILILPLFDTLRVFVVRIYKGGSPFKADRRHMHHKLLDLGFTHIQTTLILLTVNAGFIVMAFALQGLNDHLLIAINFLLALGLSQVPNYFLRKKEQTTDVFAGLRLETVLKGTKPAGLNLDTQVGATPQPQIIPITKEKQEVIKSASSN